MGDEFDMDAWLDDYQPVVVEAKVVQKAALLAEHSRLEQALLDAQQAAGDVLADPAVGEARRAVQACESEIAASQKVFTFQSTGHEAWQSLKRKHPPTPEDTKVGSEVHMDTFAPAAIAMFSLEPKITLPQAETMMRKLPPGEVEKVYAAVLQANGEVIGPPKSVLAALTERFQANAASSTTALPEASPDDGSSGTLADPAPESSGTTTD